MNNAETYLVPHVFTRHKLNLHTLLLENQAWFSARDLGRLLGRHLETVPFASSMPTSIRTCGCSAMVGSNTHS